MTTPETALRYEAPMGGTWELDSAHVERPVTRYHQPLMSMGLERGSAEGAARYGMLLDRVGMVMVNGLPYVQPIPMMGKPGGALPPRLLFALALKLHPGLRKRIAAARETMSTKRWRGDLRRWNEDVRPSLTARFRELAGREPAAMDGQALLAHLVDCRQAATDGLVAHHGLSFPCYLPVGDFLVHAAQWTGCAAGEALLALRGGGGAPAGGVTAEFARVVADSPEALALLMSDRPAMEVIGGLRRTLGPPADAWWRDASTRLVTAVDLDALLGSEVPQLVVRGLRGFVSRPGPAPPSVAASELRARVPESHRAEYDALLEEARLVQHLRDERIHAVDAWALGLLRRVLLVVGARLVEAGRLVEAEHAIDLDPDEAEAMLDGRSGPSADEVADRVSARNSTTIDSAPQILGPPETPMPPLEWMPPEVARMTKAVLLYAGTMSEEPTIEPTTELIRGHGASPGHSTGTARLVLTAADFGRVQQGDVLVARVTSPEYNGLLPVISAIVTDRGGLLSHAAIVCREYRIPGVVGCRDATARIPDGAQVSVDGETGTVRVLT